MLLGSRPPELIQRRNKAFPAGDLVGHFLMIHCSIPYRLCIAYAHAMRISQTNPALQPTKMLYSGLRAGIRLIAIEIRVPSPWNGRHRML